MLQLGVVTVLDVLGWKGIWQRKSDPIVDLEDIVSLIQKRVLEKERGTNSLPTAVMIVSDTIVFFTKADYKQIQEKIEFHGELCAEAIPFSITKGLPLRGATTYGEVVINNDKIIFAGKAIDEAAAWHEQADWIGVFLTPSAYLFFNDYSSQFWYDYLPPLKKKEIELQTLSVNWVKTASGEFNFNETKKHFVQLAPIVPEIVSKITNAIKFIEKVLNPTPL